MKTSQISSLSLVTLGALSNELLKIAAAEKKKPSKFKKYLKNSAIVAGGYGLGHGLGMLADKAATKAFGDKWSKMVPESKKKWIYPALGAASAGSFLANEYLHHKKQQKANENE